MGKPITITEYLTVKVEIDSIILKDNLAIMSSQKPLTVLVFFSLNSTCSNLSERHRNYMKSFITIL